MDSKRCRFFAQGNCRKGTACKFVHQAEFTGAVKPIRIPMHSVQGQPVCKFFAKGGCKFGPQCRYRHDALASISASPSTCIWQRPIQAGNIHLLNQLLDNLQFDVNSEQNLYGLWIFTPLGYAVYCGQKETVQMLLSRGANINWSWRTWSLQLTDTEPRVASIVTPLSIALERKNEDLVYLLVHAGADPQVGFGIGTAHTFAPRFEIKYWFPSDYAKKHLNGTLSEYLKKEERRTSYYTVAEEQCRRYDVFVQEYRDEILDFHCNRIAREEELHERTDKGDDDSDDGYDDNDAGCGGYRIFGGSGRAPKEDHSNDYWDADAYVEMCDVENRYDVDLDTYYH